MYAFAGPINSGASPTASTTVATGEPDHIAVDGSGTLYVINTGLETFTYAGGVLTAGSAVSSPVVVSPLAVVNDMAGNIVESDNGTGGPPLLNTITARTVTASEQLALASTAGQIAHDPSSGYVYVISRNAASYFLQVYDTSSGTGTSVLPLAVLILSQSGVGNSGIAVDANFVYIAAGNGVTLYPKYSPTSPYSLYRKAR